LLPGQLTQSRPSAAAQRHGWGPQQHLHSKAQNRRTRQRSVFRLVLPCLSGDVNTASRAASCRAWVPTCSCSSSPWRRILVSSSSCSTPGPAAWPALLADCQWRRGRHHTAHACCRCRLCSPAATCCCRRASGLRARLAGRATRRLGGWRPEGSEAAVREPRAAAGACARGGRLQACVACRRVQACTWREGSCVSAAP
jgi:hypothetical protein